jgi:hypothetical protein
MTSQQKNAIGSMLDRISSTGAFLGAIIIIVQIGDFKGRIETTVANHERRIEKVEFDIVCVERELSGHEIKQAGDK